MSETYRLETAWSSPDPTLAKVLREIDALPAFSVERLEAEAYLHLTQVRVCWRLIEQERRRARGRTKE